MARPGLDATVTARLAKALHQAEASRRRSSPTPRRRNTLAAVTDPSLLHAGVLTYYRQAGLRR